MNNIDSLNAQHNCTFNKNVACSSSIKCTEATHDRIIKLIDMSSVLLNKKPGESIAIIIDEILRSFDFIKLGFSNSEEYYLKHYLSNGIGFVDTLCFVDDKSKLSDKKIKSVEQFQIKLLRLAYIKDRIKKLKMNQKKEFILFLKDKFEKQKVLSMSLKLIDKKLKQILF